MKIDIRKVLLVLGFGLSITFATEMLVVGEVFTESW